MAIDVRCWLRVPAPSCWPIILDGKTPTCCLPHSWRLGSPWGGIKGLEGSFSRLGALLKMRGADSFPPYKRELLTV